MLFFAVEFFGFAPGTITFAAGCNYTVTAFQEANNYTTASPGQTLTFNTSVSERGDQSCATSVNIQLTHSINPENPVFNTQSSQFGSNGIATASFQYKVPDGYNQIIFKGQVAVGNSIATASAPWTVKISGAGILGSQSRIILDPQKQQYSDGDSIAIYVSIDSALYSQIKSRNVSSIYLNLLINGQGAFSGTTVALDDLASDGGAGYGQFTVSQKNGFKDGANTMTVELWQAGSQIKLGSVPTNLQAQGLAATQGIPPTTAGTNSTNSGSQGIPPTTQGIPPTGTSAGGTPAAANGDKLYNPLPEEELTHAFLVVVQGFLGIVGIWAVMFIIIGGFQMVIAAGDEEMYTKAKKTLVWAVLGLVVALLSFSIIAIVQDLLGSNIKPVGAAANFKQIAQK